MRRVAVLSTAMFVALLPFGWSVLPWNMQFGDLLFPILIVAAEKDRLLRIRSRIGTSLSSEPLMPQQLPKPAIWSGSITTLCLWAAASGRMRSVSKDFRIY